MSVAKFGVDKLKYLCHFRNLRAIISEKITKHKNDRGRFQEFLLDA